MASGTNIIHLPTDADAPPISYQGKSEKTDESLADKLLTLVEQMEIKTFTSTLGKQYAIIPVGEFEEIVLLEDRAFAQWLARTYRKENRKSINAEAIRQAVFNISAEIKFDEREQIEVNIRTGRDKIGNMWYYLSDSKRRSVCINLDGWEVKAKSDIPFLRFPHQASQCLPVSGGDVNKVFNHIRIKESKMLFLCWLVSSFIPGFPHPMPIFFGEKGSAKTTSCEMLKSLIDPSALKTLSLDKDASTLNVHFEQHWFLPYDNVSYIDKNTSDVFCKAITGASVQQRKLRTNSESEEFRYQRIIAINGISNVATRADLLERSIMVELGRIRREDRKTLADIWESFERDKPEILGGIFDTVCKALRVYPTINLDGRLLRAGDFTVWGYAIAETLELGGGEKFLSEYEQSFKLQVEEAIEQDPITNLITHFIDGEVQRKWQGNATQLLNGIKNIASIHGVNINASNFPKDASHLSRRLRASISNLEVVGITCDMPTTPKKINGKCVKIITISRAEWYGNWIGNSDNEKVEYEQIEFNHDSKGIHTRRQPECT